MKPAHEVTDTWANAQFVYLCFTSLQQRGHLETSSPFTVPCEKNVKLGKYTVPTGNRSPGRHVEVHHATAVPRKCSVSNQKVKPHPLLYKTNL